MSQNILFIIDGLPGGGAERVVLTLAEGMLAQGHEVTLISLRDVCHYSLPVGLNYQVVADQARGPLRKLGELRRRAKQLDHAITQLQTNLGHFDRVFSNLPKTD
ncbi:glycosyltransferase, partial [Plesiomonas shigelloides]|uniref:glycosyltransferase n=1 Tax=Plesiomonas shigelloides TaxID=703 RepID=UPI001E602BC5